MTRFRLQMVHELSNGSIYPLQGADDEVCCNESLHIM